MARKMVLVPENYLSNMQQQHQHRRVQANPLVRSLSELDSEMDNILSRQDMTDDEKLKLYNQVLQKYLEYDSQRKEKHPLHVKVVNPSGNSENTDQSNLRQSAKTTQIEDEIIDSVPKTGKKKARLLINKLKNNDEVMFWNDLGELTYDGKAIPGTSIVDLVRDAMGDRKRFQPSNYELFVRGLARINTPLDWIGNETRKKTLEEYKSGKRGPEIEDDDFDNSVSSITPPSSPIKKKTKGSGGKRNKQNPKWINY